MCHMRRSIFFFLFKQINNVNSKATRERKMFGMFSFIQNMIYCNHWVAHMRFEYYCEGQNKKPAWYKFEIPWTSLMLFTGKICYYVHSAVNPLPIGVFFLQNTYNHLLFSFLSRFSIPLVTGYGIKKYFFSNNSYPSICQKNQSS